MSSVQDFLEHHGVKGQKWGVRNDKGHEGQRARTRRIAALDSRFARNMNSPTLYIKVHNKAAKQSNDVDIPRINNKPEYKNQDFTRDTPLRRKYYKEHQTAHINNLEKAANSFGTNASGTKKYGIMENDDGSWLITLRDVKHAIGVDEFVVRLKLDDKGYIIKLIPDETPLFIEQSTDITNFLSHFGIKGQKWGVRNKRGHGGRKPATPLNKHFEEKRSVRKLSDAELNKRIKRMELEKRYSDLSSGNKSVKKGDGLAQQILHDTTKNTLTKLAGDVSYFTGKQIIKKALGKKFDSNQVEEIYKEMFSKKKK